MELVNILVEPSSYFDRLGTRPKFTLPLTLAMAASLAIGLLYYQRVDFDWLIDQLLIAQKVPAAQQDMVRGMFSPGMFRATSLATALVITPLIFVLMAAYYAIAGKLTGVSKTFKEWFAFSAWISIPNLLASVAGLISVLMMSPQTALDQALVTHLDPMLIHLDASNRWHSLASSVDVFNVWCIALSVIGWRRWTNQSMGNSLLISVFPYAIFYGIWASRVTLSV